ncbi:hypothetical protein FNV43_RR10658 [Rhamnella rubrinervis]|uniref:Pectinesterase inhibitor domain-containing protein n=1 Tax=Rhamnella rubrinervis TaxID=2594499 RepID=A0A8K0H497_9ROSA|nr:hypothetical protein FNV43_RR10658 [Rhamnella rubrinervis]
MDFPTQCLKFFTIFVLIFISSSPSPTNASSKLVDTVCKETKNYNTRCQQVLGSDPRTKSVEDPHVLAKITLQFSIADAEKSLDFIKKTVKENNTQAIRQCEGLYEAVVASFKSALGELEEDPLTSNYDILTAADDADACENELTKGGGQVPSISARNNGVKFYSHEAMEYLTQS